ncbi:9f419f08-21d4-43ef-941d-53fea6db3941-CDS [Sclerotinia trifoliorum]|uniref:9f419f08-21d4-43ef-941d-53fea6db3941-CDS n=1 Tax=Sclerotinia trifoliorum TaxID=28548 RepID=A0A8H2VZI7_9HELO|nr:9f419f08-21d4-43ef-941d-53fea6db3941-CDS [Sclerotinia trifoliorum]
MPYNARSDVLTEPVANGGLEDPRAAKQRSFSERMTCRDLTDFIINTADISPLEPRYNRESHIQKSNRECQAKLGRVLSRSKEIRLPAAEQDVRQPLSDLLPGPIVTGGLSRSPAFDCLPVVSHWAERTDEPSAADHAATVRIFSTWEAIEVIGEGATMQFPLGAPCWSLKSHGISPVDPGSSKFSQKYLENTKTLVTTVALARRVDTPQTGGVLSAASDISRMRNTRVADAVDCALGLLSDASELLAARNKVIATGNPERLAFAEVHEVVLPSWCSARKPLPPKLSGVALSNDPATIDVLAREGCEGPLLNTSIFSMAVGYNRGVYGGSISGLWAIMDSAFVLDYSIGKDSPEMAEKLAFSFAEVAAVSETAVYAGDHITDIRVVKGCNYSCLRQKAIIEDTSPVESRPCIVVWKDLARLARYKLADAVFCHVYYDSGGGEQMAAMAGLGCVAHDWIDMGADLACGEISNIIPSLTGGSFAEELLAEVYSRFMGSMIWYRDNDPYNPAALCILFTHWWQLANCRHRPITLLGRTDLDTVNKGIAATIPEGRPSLEHFRACGTKIERSDRPLANAEERLRCLLSSNPLPETQAVIDLLVKPVLAYVKGGDRLPFENEYVGAVLAAEIAYPHGQKIIELWDLAIVMWECGAMWAAGVAGLCYTHTGKFNCDRARNDLSETTWS